MASDGASSISVTVRVRPFTIREAAQLTKSDDGAHFLGEGSLAAAPTPRPSSKGLHPVIKVIDDKCLVFDPPQTSSLTKFSRNPSSTMGKRVKDQTFGFDRVFDENATQDDIYTATTRPLLDNVLDGYNATVFAYGATGCGKTHTITGTTASPGIIFLTMQELFDKIAERSDEKHTEVSLSYLEIYNETIRDLLVEGGSKQGLMLREDANQAVSVAGLSTHHPKDVQQVMEMVVNGNAWRTVSPTEANATSSRSHAVLQINVAQKDRNADINEPHTMATLSIIDLAGSERASATKNRGARLLEGANINKSLLALGSCINALCDPRQKNHVPYRNSKLTRLLKFSLGGNCKTVMIVCVSPSSAHFDETQNTLRYANRAKNIQTKVTRNVYNVNRHVKDFLIKIDEQMALINELRAQQADSEALAFAKFRKMSDKREAIAREGVIRIRAAYDLSQAERHEKVSCMKKLRQVENRIALLNAWISAFDSTCETREELESGEPMPSNLTATRKTAQGILLELEGSRQHFHQRLEKNNWERAMESALSNAVRQLVEAEAIQEGCEIASITREAEFLKCNAQREALKEVLDIDKGGDLGTMQVLLAAHFDAISAFNDILHMNETSAVQHAKKALTRLFNTCSAATSSVVKPDGSLAIVQAFPPTKRGTPKRKPQVMMPTEATTRPPLLPAFEERSQPLSPMKSSPKRRKAPIKKGLTPRKSPKKRGVRWRDDTDSGALAEYAATPQKLLFTPDDDSHSAETKLTPPPVPEYLHADEESSPSAPEISSLDLRPKNSRFQAGFLSKKSLGSPAPVMQSVLGSSDVELSPLRTLDPLRASNRTSTVATEFNKPEADSSSEGENSSFLATKADSARIRNALKQKRESSLTSAGRVVTDSAARAARRRSPGQSGRDRVGSATGVTDENAMFTAGQARRMVKSDKPPVFHSDVLSPRSAPIQKHSSGSINARRQTSDGSHTGSRQSSITAASTRLIGTVGSTPKSRESVAGRGGAGVWR